MSDAWDDAFTTETATPAAAEASEHGADDEPAELPAEVDEEDASSSAVPEEEPEGSDSPGWSDELPAISGLVLHPVAAAHRRTPSSTVSPPKVPSRARFAPSKGFE